MIAPLRWILGIVITVASVLFALANRAPVQIVWSPLHAPVNIPVFVLLLGGVAAGFVAGGAAVWLNESLMRRERRKQRRLIRKLEEQLRSANENKSEKNPLLRLPFLNKKTK